MADAIGALFYHIILQEDLLFSTSCARYYLVFTTLFFDSETMTKGIHWSSDSVEFQFFFFFAIETEIATLFLQIFCVFYCSQFLVSKINVIQSVMCGQSNNTWCICIAFMYPLPLQNAKMHCNITNKHTLHRHSLQRSQHRDQMAHTISIQKNSANAVRQCWAKRENNNYY